MNHPRRWGRLLVAAVFVCASSFNFRNAAVTADANETASNAAIALSQSSLSSGGYHNCVVLSTGAAKCWGMGNDGQLGNSSQSDSSTPVQVTGLSSGVKSVVVGGYHSCALLTTGAVKCWGRNYYGQLGNGTTTFSTSPVQVTGLTSGVTAISAGDYHTCAVLTGGGVKCWGYNQFGQLGDNSMFNKNEPTQVSGLTSGVTAITAGYEHTCALLSTGGVKCWGEGSYGRLGWGVSDQYVPVQVTNLTSGVTAISAGGFHTCALLSTGGVKCWGQNNFGQVGVGNTSDKNDPTDVNNLSSGAIAISSGMRHTCALLSTESARCWGYNFYGQLGDSSNTHSSNHVQVTGLASGVVAINAGDYHACALTSAGAVKCWGRNGQRQLGDGTTNNSNSPVSVASLSSGVGATTTTTTTTTVAPMTTTTSTTTTIAPTTTTSTTSTSSSTTSTTSTVAPSTTTSSTTTAPPNTTPTSTTLASSDTTPVNSSSGNNTSQSSTTLASTTSVAPTTTTTTTVPPVATVDIEKFISTSSDKITALANEADSNNGAALLINGTKVPVTVKTTTTSTTLTYGNASLKVTCFDSADNPIALSSEGRFTLRQGDSVSMTASGFAPGSHINVAIFSDPIALGTATTNTNGHARQQWNIPDTIAPGDHTLVFSGDLANVENTVFGLRIVVNQESFITRFTSNTWTRIIVALGIASGLLIPANRRRKQRTA